MSDDLQQHCGCGDKDCLACFPAAAELARLRAEVERLTAERDEADRIATLRGNYIEFTLLPQMMDLEFALADEHQRAEELAEALNDADTILGTYIDLFGGISDKSPSTIKGLHGMRHST